VVCHFRTTIICHVLNIVLGRLFNTIYDEHNSNSPKQNQEPQYPICLRNQADKFDARCHRDLSCHKSCYHRGYKSLDNLDQEIMFVLRLALVSEKICAEDAAMATKTFSSGSAALATILYMEMYLYSTQPADKFGTGRTGARPGPPPNHL
jgi:hypothetical protein